MRRGVSIWPAIVVAASCAKANNGPVGTDAPVVPADVAIDGCGSDCDTDMDGVKDGTDQCPNTQKGEVVNNVGCADSQLMPMLAPTFRRSASRGRIRATSAGQVA